MSGQDVGFFWANTASPCPDLVIENGDLKADEGLETAVLISLFSDKRVTLEQLPRGLTDRRGWWADLISEPQDDEIGSQLWRLEPGKILASTPNEVESIIKDALDWLIEDGVAAEITVAAVRAGLTQVEAEVVISRPSGDDIPFRFLWDGQRLKILESEV